MRPTLPGAAPSDTARPEWTDTPASRWHRPVFLVFLVAYAAELALAVLDGPPPAAWSWIDGGFFVLAAATVLTGTARRLPAQNVATAAFLVGGLAFVLAAFGARTGLPFGPYTYPDSTGGGGGLAPWLVPFVWVVVILTGRGVARLILRPHRRLTYYGFWVIGLTALLAVAWLLAFEPFATRVRSHWAWGECRLGYAWLGVPPTCFLGWGVAVILILGFTTPWLLNKQPVRQPVDWHPLVLWLLLLGWLTVANFRAGLGPAAVAGLATALLSAGPAVRGGRATAAPPAAAPE